MDTKKEEAVAYLGPKASYTHQAALSEFPESKYIISPQTTIEDIFAAVQSSTASHGVVPFENSSNGSVVFTLDLFADLHGRYPDISVCGEIYLQVHHCLLGHAAKSQGETATSEPAHGISTQPGNPRVKPLHDIKHIKKLYSHPQAWGQCKLFLAAYFKGIERQDVSSTSKAAELVAQNTTGSSAAISSRMAAGMNNLDVLAQGIEDNQGNSTRFFIIRRQQDVVAPDAQNASVEMADYKTLVSFTVEHGEPGALADCLAIFKKHKLNLTSINTRPSGETPWHYVFFIEFRGRKRADGAGGAVNEALQELEKVAKNGRWLGSWSNKLKE
ncbi:hypothetical protein LTR08_006054 [Meristemomyces frigidus]|nr:hypothetical protein LTR08_006054 [Meristemomyces frigidus]